MVKKFTAILLCLIFCFSLFPVSAASPQASASFNKSEIVVGESVSLIINVSEDVTFFKANIVYNNYFLSYNGKGLGFDIDSGEYTVSFTPGETPYSLTCTSSNFGAAVLTLRNVTCTTADGEVKLPDISAAITVTPDYVPIYTKEDLNKIRNDLSGYYILMNNIEFTEADFSENGAFYNDGFGWIPIGAVVKTPFLGEFNGNNYSITGLKVNKAYYNYCGLFGVNKGVVRNLRINDACIDGKVGINMSSKASSAVVLSGGIDYEDKDVWTEPDDSITEESLDKYDRTGESTANLGIICGFNLGSVKESYCSGVVIGNNASGGIAGRNNGVISLCATDAEVVSEGIAGGIAGVTGTYSKISDVVSDGGVTAAIAGGIVGKALGNVHRAYTLSEIISDDKFASFGKNEGVTASELYAFGALNSEGKTEIKDISELASLTFTGGNWTYTSVKPYPTPLADLIKTVLSGDLNGDGEVNTTDLAALKLFLAGNGEIDQTAGDLSGDGEVNTSDLASLKILLAGA